MAKNKPSQLRRPSKTFTHCPCCESPNLIRLEVDVLCVACDWSSIEAFVDSGGMDNIFAAHRDHFIQVKDNSSGTTVDAASEELGHKLIRKNISA